MCSTFLRPLHRIRKLECVIILIIRSEFVLEMRLLLFPEGLYVRSTYEGKNVYVHLLSRLL
jgi:hypothetical protein